MRLNLREGLAVVRELIDQEVICVFDANTNEVHSGCAVRSAEKNGGAIQLWIEECDCHQLDRDAVYEPGGIFMPSGEYCYNCGCELERYTLPPAVDSR